MADSSRKIKNPLLSAAGPGFPFENFAENAVLMPVTPATPSILQDDGEVDSFIGQETQPKTQDSSSQQLSSEIQFPTYSEFENPTAPVQKQGYFSSILSSLPNLSLSSIKGENQKPTPQNVTSGYTGVQEPFVRAPEEYAALAASPPTNFVAPTFHDPHPQNLPLSSNRNLGAQGSAPLQSHPPPTALPPAGGSTSYRLGNQRRLKYAPPPDLTSTSSQQFPAPNLQPFVQPNLSSPQTLYNPSSQISFLGPGQTYSPSAPPVSGNPSPAQAASLQGSIRSSPIPSGPVDSSLKQTPRYFTPGNQQRDTSIQNIPVLEAAPSFGPANNRITSQTTSQGSTSSPQNIPSRFPEPSTPQNTPAYGTLGFESFSANSTAITSSFSGQGPSTNFYGASHDSCVHPQPSQTFSATPNRIATTFEIPKPVNIHPEENLGNTIEPNSNLAQFIEGSSSELSQHQATFTPSVFEPLSAAKVSEKLEHLLAEQNEQSAFEHLSDQIESAADYTSQLTPATTVKSEGQSTDDKPANGSSLNSETLSEIDLKSNEALACLPPLETSFAGLSLNSGDSPLGENPDVSTRPTREISGRSSSSYYTSNVPPSSQSIGNEVPPIGSSSIFGSEPQNPHLQQPHVSQFDTTYSLFPQDPRNGRTAANYFGKAEGLNAPSFYNPAEFHQQSTSSFFTPGSTAPSSSVGHVDDARSIGQEQNVLQQSYSALKNPVADQELPNFGVPGSFRTDSQKPFNVLNPVYGAPTQSVPTFYNPAQFDQNPFSSNNQNLPTTSYSPFHSDTSSFLNLRKIEGNIEQGGFDTLPSIEGEEYLPPPTPPITTVVPEATGSATLSPVQMSTNPVGGHITPETLPPSLRNLAAGRTDRQMQYRPVYHHWFYRKKVETKILWLPFSMHDSLSLEDVSNSSEITAETLVPTDGGRYDVHILKRERTPVYWTGSPSPVRRCSWFYKGPMESRCVPYDEQTADRLEEEYKQACTTDTWNRRIELNNGEHIIFHSSTVQVHYLQASSADLAASWGNGAPQGSEGSSYLQGAASRPRVVKRGVDEFDIDEGEPEKVDHLLFLVHGIGSVCDLKFRSVEEVVDEFRSISLQLVRSHYRTASEQGAVNRVEVLPISWHTTLHSEDTGIDRKLRAITLESIPKLRHFTNDTLVDILFYTSPMYCQTIVQTVGNELNRLHSLFKERNPSFQGGIYLGGHSLGSLILFDLLCHQKPPKEDVPEAEQERDSSLEPGDEDTLGPIKPMKAPVLKRRLSRKISYVMGAAGTGQPFINYPQIHFQPNAFFALGSPIGMFVTVRGIDTLGEDFALPTCPAFFNVFHPFDPVAYRVEALINPDAHKYRPMLIPHHKGRKRMHLELKETMARVGADLKQKLLDSVRSTWNSVYQLAMFQKPDNHSLEREIDKVVEEQFHGSSSELDQQQVDDGGADVKVGKLNGGRRIDYVLQEAPFEYINEYIFALTSHVCYWESEDTMLMMLKEIYGSMGIQTDAQLPPQTMTIERATTSSSPSVSSPSNIEERKSPSAIGMDPTAAISSKPIGPPPTSGFVRKS